MPTFSPGWKCVPRWRTMISPAATSCPPKRFTPRRFDSESRPFLELPPAFLCAISLASLLANDFGNPDFSVGLPMTEAAAIILASLELDHVDLGGAALGRHLARSEERRVGKECRCRRQSVNSTRLEYLTRIFAKAHVQA